jgi:hypothetical protein
MSRVGLGFVVAALAACGGDSGSSTTPPPPVVGKRVVYTANTVDPGAPTELWVTDTAGNAQSPTRIAGTLGGTTTRIDRPFVSAGGDYLGARFAPYGAGAAGCPASMTIFNTATGVATIGYPLSDGACLHELEFNPPGNAFGMRFSFAGASGPNFATTTTSHFPTTIFTQDTTSGVQTGGTVQRFRWTLDGNTPTWTEASGLYSSMSSGPGSILSLRSADVPPDYRVGQIAGLPYAVYVAPGETRFRITNLVPFTAQSQAYLTNALAGGDALGAFELSPDGAHMLYEVRISGVWQLWLVSLAAPLGEQRVDAAAPLIGASRATEPSGSDRAMYEFNTDSTRFAWSGDVGGGSLRLNTATVAAPTVATILTPNTEGPFVQLFWSDPNTVVYGDFNFGLPGPLRPHSLRTVSIGAPLTTVPLYDASVNESDNYLWAADMCSDGTVVYETFNVVFTTGGDSWQFNGLFAVHPSDPGGLRRITPWYGNLGNGVAGVFEFDCE